MSGEARHGVDSGDSGDDRNSRSGRTDSRPERVSGENSAPVILSNNPGSFSHSVLAERHPALIRQIREAFPFTPHQQQALDALLEEITGGDIQPLDTSAHDHETWSVLGREHFGRSWFDVPFLWAESFFYRRLLAAIGYFDPRPWHGVDPFAPFKQAELHSSTVDEELGALDELASRPADEQAEALLHASLWGNRADLGFRISAGDTTDSDTTAKLVADDSAVMWSLLTTGAPATVSVVADNAGRELVPDLILIDHLISQGHASDVVLHIKPYPYYVSDATMADVLDCMRRLVRAPGRAGEIGKRLWAAMEAGRLDVRAHPFFCAPLPYKEMPEDLREVFGACALTIMKGDLNYRRLVGDQLWAPTTPFADPTAYFPGPVVALRTLKCDVIVGLSERMLNELEATGREWRTSGTHALIQARR
ncbi:damage-control phosphatase ARMT1 family protein [Streptomyces sp. NPDC004647]|uniref:damage-control phosphatase ARMT1 family protein n=1 Tax=Streptomyces sp. NPDC004647 TaxID=3154671 RepID=UPI0033A665A8